MPGLKTHRLFISHAWEYKAGCERLVTMLSGAKYFQWLNYSVPADKPKDAHHEEELAEALVNRIRPTNCILVISGMYAPHRNWIQHETEVAAEWGKPIMGIKPRGSAMVPQAVSSVADAKVGWYTPSIISEIRKRAL